MIKYILTTHLPSWSLYYLRQCWYRHWHSHAPNFPSDHVLDLEMSEGSQRFSCWLEFQPYFSLLFSKPFSVLSCSDGLRELCLLQVPHWSDSCFLQSYQAAIFWHLCINTHQQTGSNSFLAGTATKIYTQNVRLMEASVNIVCFNPHEEYAKEWVSCGSLKVP